MTHQDERFWTGRRIALTGATGFIGHQVALSLIELGARVTALVRASSARQRLLDRGVSCVLAPLDDVAALAAACRGVDLLIHLAGAVDFGDSWDLCREVNLDGTRNVLAAARRAGVGRVVHVSSIVTIGANQDGRLLDEEAEWNLAGVRVPYITTKREAELLALAASGKGLEVVVVNPGCVVGPDDHTGSEFGTLCRRFWHGRIPFYFAGGNNFVDVRDVALGTLRAAQLGQAGRRYLLGGHNLRLGEFFTALARAAGRFIPRFRLPVGLGRLGANLTSRLQHRQGRRPYLSPGQARLMGYYFYFSSERARLELGVTPRPLADTLADTHAFWMKPRAA